jgi:hypothetical protein
VWVRRCALTDQLGPHDDHYRLILISPATQQILVEREPCEISRPRIQSSLRLPRISIPRWSRSAAKIQSQIKERWNLPSIVLDCPGDPSRTDRVTIAEVFDEGELGTILQRFSWASLGDIPDIEFEDSESSIRGVIEYLLEHRPPSQGPFLRLGWTNELLHWVSAVVSADRRDVADGIEQLNASAHHSLLRIRNRNGPPYWFKAAAMAEDPEFQTTTLLSNLFPEYLPTIVAVRQAWSGWLMEDAGPSIEEPGFTSSESIDRIGARLAKLQQASIPHVAQLLKCGLIDQRIARLRESVFDMMPYLEDAVLSQRSTSIPPIKIWRLGEIADAFERARCLFEDISIPDALIHNDLSGGNILSSNGFCVFTDWSEAGVGNPFVAIDQLRIYFEQDRRLARWIPRVVNSYFKQWSSEVSEEQINSTLGSVRLLSIATHLLNRQQWIISEYLGNPAPQSYLRSLVRQMVNATRLDKIPVA